MAERKKDENLKSSKAIEGKVTLKKDHSHSKACYLKLMNEHTWSEIECFTIFMRIFRTSC